MPSSRSPARLVVALSVAASLAVFLVYTSLAGGTPLLRPSQLKGHQGKVQVVGKVLGPISGDARVHGLRFVLRDVSGRASIPVVFDGSRPDLFAKGRDVVAVGELRADTLFASEVSTKCPSKYAPKHNN